MTDNLSIAVHAFARCMLTSFSEDEILLLRYVNLSTNFRSQSLKVDMDPACLKHMNSVLYYPLSRGQCFLLLASGYAVGIGFGKVYVQEMFDNLGSLCRSVFSGYRLLGWWGGG